MSEEKSSKHHREKDKEGDDQVVEKSHHSRDKDKERDHKEKDRHKRSKDKDVDRHKDKDGKHKDRSDRHRDKSRDREKDRDKDSRDRKERHRDKDKDRDRHREKDRDKKERDKDKDKEKEKDRHKRSRSKDKKEGEDDDKENTQPPSPSPSSPTSDHHIKKEDEEGDNKDKEIEKAEIDKKDEEITETSDNTTSSTETSEPRKRRRKSMWDTPPDTKPSPDPSKHAILTPKVNPPVLMSSPGTTTTTVTSPVIAAQLAVETQKLVLQQQQQQIQMNLNALQGALLSPQLVPVGMGAVGGVGNVLVPTATLATSPLGLRLATTISPAQTLAIQQQTIALQQVQLAAAHTNNAAMQSRIYVGSLHFDLTETDIKNAFSPFGPIKSITMAKEPNGKSKGYAFVEYSYPDAAAAALQHMNGFTLGGRQIKVGRPHLATPGVAPLPGMPITGYPQINASLLGTSPGIPTPTYAAVTPIATAIATPIASPLVATPNPAAVAAAAAAVAAANIPTSNPATRIYVGSIHWDLTDDDVKSVFQAFGTIKSCQLMPNPETGKHKGFGFVEFEDARSAEEALSRMNGFELAGRPIKVGRANAGTMPTPAPTSSLIGLPTLPSGTVLNATTSGVSGVVNVATGSVTPAVALSKPEESLSSEENITITGNQRYLVMQKLARGDMKSISRVVVLRNMVGPDEVDAELETEVTDECSKLGMVERVVIYQERQSEKDNDVMVKIFVCFSNSAGAQTATTKLNNRWFGGRVIKAEVYDEALFLKQDYTG